MEVRRVWLTHDEKVKQQWEKLLLKYDLVPDEQVDYTIGIFDEEKIIATGSIYGNILKCIAIDSAYQNECLLTRLLQKLREKLQEIGHYHYFLYTKPETSEFFLKLGFSSIIETEDLVFMEQGLPDITDYLKWLTNYQPETKDNAAIVMNANPFTNGHLYLITEAAKRCETLFVFVLSEDRSFFDSQTRLALVKAGVDHLENVIVLETKEYMVSSATFPSYFLKDQAQLEIASVQATMDARLFKEKIAPCLSITTRYVGEEPFSEVTAIYNQMMEKVFAPDIALVISPRFEVDGEAVSATKVRELIAKKEYTAIERLVPPTTYKEIMKLKKQL